MQLRGIVKLKTCVEVITDGGGSGGGWLMVILVVISGDAWEEGEAIYVSYF